MRCINVTTSESSPPTAYDIIIMVKNRQRWQQVHVDGNARYRRRRVHRRERLRQQNNIRVAAVFGTFRLSRGSASSLTCHDAQYRRVGVKNEKKKNFEKITNTSHVPTGQFCSLLNAAVLFYIVVNLCANRVGKR